MGRPRTRNEDDGDGVIASVARAFALLRAFQPGEAHLGNRELARRTGLPKATVSRLAATLTALGYLAYSPALEKYALGTGVLALGHAFLRSNSVVALARPLMQRLADDTGAAVMLGAADGARMVLLDICQGDPTFHLKLEPGARVPHGFTALGRADLAARPPDVFAALLADYERETDSAAWPALREGLVQARRDYERYGFCFSLGDWNRDLFAVGVPMRADDGARILAFNCSGRIGTMSRERLVGDIGPRLVALRNRVYELTGGQF